MNIASKLADIFFDISTILTDIFFPKRCVGCGKYGRFLCFECAGKIERIKTDTCPECGKISEKGRFCNQCKSRTKTNLTGIVVAAKYDSGPTKELIHHLKYSGFTDLAEDLGELIAEKIIAGFDVEKFIIVPVPLHQKRLNIRGYNQAELIARYVAKKLSIPFGQPLIRRKNTESQVKFTRKKRQDNVSGVFYCKDRGLVENTNILLVDDVTTTGSTLNDCARALREAGAKKVWGIVVARNIK